MSTESFYVRNMLHLDDRQPLAVRRPIRPRQALCRAPGGDAALPADVRRKIMVERVARELFENLLFTGSDTPLVQEVQRALDREFGENLIFRYSPGSLELTVLRETPEGTEEVPPSRRADVLERAWAITLAKVDETML